VPGHQLEDLPPLLFREGLLDPDAVFAQRWLPASPSGLRGLTRGAGLDLPGQAVDPDQLPVRLGFTGSTEVGYTIADAAAKKLIPATLELGGKSANIFFPDAPWEKAIEGVEIGILFNQGQVCCAGSRVFVHEDIYDKFLADCVAAFNKVKVAWST
jgi:acyl-CoA reductase-like NAD-dependent aldehyde dehydrogenase